MEEVDIVCDDVESVATIDFNKLEHDFESVCEIYGRVNLEHSLESYVGFTESCTKYFGQDDVDERGKQNDIDDEVLLQSIQEKSGKINTFVDALTENFNNYLSCVDAQLLHIECASVDEYVRNCGELLLLNNQINRCDEMLANMENLLSGFGTSVESVSSDIASLEEQSSSMNIKMQNRIVANELVSTYIRQILVTPHLIKGICEDPINNEYVENIQVLNSKLEHATQPGLENLPSAAASIHELCKLKEKALCRIKSFFMNNINQLTSVKCNVQIIQNTKFLQYKSLFVFLVDHFPSVSFEIQNFYLQTLSNIYFHQFKTYVTFMSKLVHPFHPTQNDLVGTPTQSTSIIQNISGPSSTAFTHRANIFSLSGRASVLDQLNADPEVVTNVSGCRPNKYFEEAFRSHQTLLLHTACREFLFLTDFFVFGSTENYVELFKQIFGKTLKNLFVDHVRAFVSNSFDTVGLALLMRINTHNKFWMRSKKIPCLDGYFRAIQLLLWPRLKYLLELNIGSLEYTKPCLTNANRRNIHHPFCITRKYVELACSLHRILFCSTNDYSTAKKYLHADLITMNAAFKNCIEKVSKEISNMELRIVFLINNYDLALSLFLENNIEVDSWLTFEDDMRKLVSVYVELQISTQYDYLVRGTANLQKELEQSSDRKEQSLSSLNSTSKASASAEQLCKKFMNEWESSIRDLKTKTMDYFTDFRNGNCILKQILTQIFVVYSDFIQLLQKLDYTENNRLWHQQGASYVNTILSEIRSIS